MNPIALFQRRVERTLLRLSSSHREIVVAVIVLFFLLIGGTVGYMLIEGWNWIDGLFMTFITLTTIGFGELHPLSVMGRFFTILIAVMGIGTATFIVSRGAQVLLSQQNLKRRRMKRVIAHMDDHHILCGYGRIGRRIAQDMRASERPFVVIDANPEKVDDLDDLKAPYIEGDAQEEEILKEAGVERARGLILTLPQDSANVFVALTAREINPDLYIVARTNDHKNRNKLITAGASKVISPYEIGADRMAQVILRPHVDAFMERVLQTGALGLQMEEVVVQEGAALAGKSLSSSNFRQQFDAIVVAIVDPETDEVQFNPRADATIEPGNILVVMGNSDMISRLRREGCTG